MPEIDHHRVWNIFESAQQSGHYCAVPAALSLPAFIFSGGWAYTCHGRNIDMPWAKLDTKAATYGVALNGFHLFMALGDAEQRSP